MSLVGEVIAYVEKRRVRCVLIGGEALAVHGIARATLDADLLVADASVLRDMFWNAFASRAAVEIHRGEHDDPLVGVVRIRRRTEQADVIVGRPWVHRMLRRTMRIRVGDEKLPVIDRADLVVLKLYAAGPQDLLDVRLLLKSGGEALVEQVEKRLPDLPAGITRVWRDLRRARR